MAKQCFEVFGEGGGEAVAFHRLFDLFYDAAFTEVYLLFGMGADVFVVCVFSLFSFSGHRMAAGAAEEGGELEFEVPVFGAVELFVVKNLYFDNKTACIAYIQ